MKKSLTIFFIFCSAVLFNSFVGEDRRYVSKEDVVLKIPSTFPKPFYSFEKNPLSPDGFVLGRKLFYDPILSKDSSISCASCHQQFAAFAHIDHQLSHGINGMIGTRNVVPLQNLIWKDSYMWDGGINHLELQSISPITNPIEMNESLANVLHKLKNNHDYVAMFAKAFNDTLINSERMLKAITQFTGLMISANSRYDKYIAGTETFSDAELNGLKLFRNKCAGCHKEPLFTDNSFRNNGLKMDSSLHDVGRGKITGNPSDDYLFAVPGLRNIEVSYPYMHDGRFKKLKDVLNYYSNGNSHSENVDKDISKIGSLNDIQKKDIIAFLLTLTDKEFLYNRKFSDPSFQ